MFGIERKIARREKTSERKIKSKFVVSTASNQLDESIAFCKYLFSSFTQIYLCLSLFLTYSSLEKKKNSTKYSLSQHGDTCHPNRNDFIMLHTQHQTERVIERSIKIAWKIESLRQLMFLPVIVVACGCFLRLLKILIISEMPA